MRWNVSFGGTVPKSDRERRSAKSRRINVRVFIRLIGKAELMIAWARARRNAAMGRLPSQRRNSTTTHICPKRFLGDLEDAKG